MVIISSYIHQRDCNPKESKFENLDEAVDYILENPHYKHSAQRQFLTADRWVTLLQSYFLHTEGTVFEMKDPVPSIPNKDAHLFVTECHLHNGTALSRFELLPQVCDAEFVKRVVVNNMKIKPDAIVQLGFYFKNPKGDDKWFFKLPPELMAEVRKYLPNAIGG